MTKWKLVPVEPTDEMVEAAWGSKGPDYVGWAKCIYRASDAYSAMLEATPQPPALTDERIFELAESFGEFKYGDAQGFKRIEFARAIELELLGENK